MTSPLEQQVAHRTSIREPLRLGHSGWRWHLLTATLFFAVAASTGNAQAPSAVRAAGGAIVKLVSLSSQGGQTGAGVLIDPRGYLICPFHVVGKAAFASGEPGFPGALVSSDNRVYVSFAAPPVAGGSTRWIASVVRADVARDVALLRILSDADGRPARGVAFPALASTRDSTPSRGDRVWLVGMSSGGQELVSHAGRVLEGVRDRRGALTAIRIRPEDGGQSNAKDPVALDERGRLLGLSRGDSRSLVPFSRVPNAWLVALRRGQLTTLRVDGLPRLEVGRPLELRPQFASASLDAREVQAALLAEQRPGVVRVEPDLLLELWDNRGRKVRSGRGTVRVEVNDGTRLAVAVVLQGKARTLRSYTLWYESLSPYRSERHGGSPWRPPAPGAGAVAEPLRRNADNPFFAVPNPQRPRQEKTAERDDVKQPTATIHGKVVDAVTGRAVAGATMLVAKPHIDLQSLLRRFLSGGMTESRFREQLEGSTRSDIFGRFELNGVTRSRSYPAAVVAPSYAPAVFTLRLKWHERLVDLGRIEMTR